MSAATDTKTIEPFVISREFDAPRDLLFACFTDPEHMKRWWGPKGFKVLHSKMDLKPGGTYHYGLEAPNGSSMWGRFVYREIEAPKRIVLVGSFSDASCGLTRHPLNASWPLEMLSIFTFEEVGKKRSRLTVSWAPINESDEERAAFEAGRGSMQQGWTGTLDQLEAYLATFARP